MNRRWLYLGAAGVLLVAASITMTLWFIGYSEPEEEYSVSSSSRRFDLYEGFSLCEDAIRVSIGGKVVTLDTDDRAAKYDPGSNTNRLFFVAVYQKKTGLIGTSFDPEEKVFIRCDVSAKTNRVEAIRLRTGEDENYTDVRRQ